MLCLLRYEGKKMENKKIKIKIPYKIQFDLQLSLNPEVLRLAENLLMDEDGEFYLFVLFKKNTQISQRQGNKN